MKVSDTGILAIISGFSGVGKGTLVKKLLENYDNYALSISATTRQMRVGEKDGESYFFLTKEEFENRIEKNDFLEYANYVGNYYGTPKSYVVEQLKQGKDVLLEIEIQGAMQVKKLMPEALTIFVMPPSADTLKDRLVGRGTEKKEVIEARLGRAVEESQGIENYDYILVNDDLEESTKRLNELISLAHDASFRNYNFINKIREELKVFRKEI